MLLVIWILTSVLLSLYSKSYILLFFVPVFVSPFLRERKVLVDTDERELFLEYKSSHFAYLSYYAVVFFIFADYLLLKYQNPPVEIYLIAIVPGLVKWMFFASNKMMAGRFAIILSVVFGSFWLIFALLSHGISLGFVYESVFGLSLILSAVIGVKYKKVGGVLLLMLSAVFLVLLIKNMGSRSGFTAIVMFFILTLPPFVSGCFLLMTEKSLEE
jgi:hypothetical protein